MRKVLVELQSEVWPETLAKLVEAGFSYNDMGIMKDCSASVIVGGLLADNLYDECSKIPGVIGIWADVRISPFGPSSK